MRKEFKRQDLVHQFYFFVHLAKKFKLILGNDEAFPFLLKKEFIELDEDFSDEEDEDVPVPSTSKVKLLKYKTEVTSVKLEVFKWEKLFDILT